MLTSGLGKRGAQLKEGVVRAQYASFNIEEHRQRLERARRSLRAAGYALVVATNQSGIGRGYFDEHALTAVNEAMCRLLREASVELDAIYYCPLAPINADRTVIDDPMRKPGPGMLQQAAREHDLVLESSWMVGDAISDVLAGINAGCLGSKFRIVDLFVQC